MNLSLLEEKVCQTTGAQGVFDGNATSTSQLIDNSWDIVEICCGAISIGIIVKWDC